MNFDREKLFEISRTEVSNYFLYENSGENLVWHDDVFHYNHFYTFHEKFIFFFSAFKKGLYYKAPETNIYFTASHFTHPGSPEVIKQGFPFVAASSETSEGLYPFLAASRSSNALVFHTSFFDYKNSVFTNLTHPAVCHSTEFQKKGCVIENAYCYSGEFWGVNLLDRTVIYLSNQRCDVIPVNERLGTNFASNVFFRNFFFSPTPYHIWLKFDVVTEYGIGGVQLVLFDVKDAKVLKKKEVHYENTFFYAVIPQDFFVFISHNREGMSSYFEFVDVGSFERVMLKEFHFETQELPYDFRFTRKGAYGFLKKKDKLEFFKWEY